MTRARKQAVGEQFDLFLPYIADLNFRDQRDPDSRSRPVFAFHTPEHLLELVQQPDTLRARLRQFGCDAGRGDDEAGDQQTAEKTDEAEHHH